MGVFWEGDWSGSVMGGLGCWGSDYVVIWQDIITREERFLGCFEDLGWECLGRSLCGQELMGCWPLHMTTICRRCRSNCLQLSSLEEPANAIQIAIFYQRYLKRRESCCSSNLAEIRKMPGKHLIYSRSTCFPCALTYPAASTFTLS